MKIKLPPFENGKILVIGDVMLDRYWHGETLRISPEAPVPVVNIGEQQARPGGAGNVAVNLAALGAKPVLLGAIGDDEAGDRLLEQLESFGIEHCLQRLAKQTTITKLRVLSQHQQLLRLDFEEQRLAADQGQLIADFKRQLVDVNAVIISDYHKGTLHDAAGLIQLAKAAGVPVFVDPKGASFSIYHGADVLTPNRKEFEHIVGECDSEEELVNKAESALQANDLGALLVTRGGEGMSLIQREQVPFHQPARALEVFDVTGAGDTVIAILAAAVAVGESLEAAVIVANTGAGVAVTKLGAVAVTVPELRRALLRQQASVFGVLSEEAAKLAVIDAHAHGETVVMTNGCFDILHAGHIAYLDEAKALGKRLMVAVNDDDSVRRLKGESRPMNDLAARMAVLAGLRSVDWVVPFSEDTPARLISELNPNVLVKGGDYKVEEVAGADHVLANGGDVKMLQFVDGCSTTSLINKIRGDRS